MCIILFDSLPGIHVCASRTETVGEWTERSTGSSIENERYEKEVGIFPPKWNKTKLRDLQS